MNADFLLDAVGLLDDDLIAEADAPLSARPSLLSRVQRAAPLLAACLVLVLALRMVPFGGMSGGGGEMNSTGAGEGAGGDFSSPGEPSSPAGGSSGGAPESSEDAGDRPAAIMVDGVLYWSTGREMPGEPDPSVIQETTSYTDGMPEEDGQSNFAREGTWYAVTDDGVLVLIDQEWVLFEPAPSWAQEN